MEFSPLVGGRWDYGEWGNDLACSPVLALTIQKISINYCSFYLFEGTLIGPEDWPRSQVVTKRGGKPRAGNIEHCSDYTRGYQKREKNAGSRMIRRGEDGIADICARGTQPVVFPYQLHLTLLSKQYLPLLLDATIHAHIGYGWS